MTTRRRLMSLILGGVVGLPLVGCAGGLPTEVGATRIKLASFNIWHNLGDWAARRPLLIEALRAQDADIIALQEVLEDAAVGLENQAQMLARELGDYRVAFVSTDQEGAGRRYGNALLTRLPVVAEERVLLEPLSDYRTALRLRVLKDGQPVDVVVTHLAWQPDAGAVRAQQIAHLLSWLPRDGKPVVIAGDFNAPLDDDGLAALTGPRFVSALAAGAVPTTLNPAKGHKERVIDHIFVEAGQLNPIEAHIFGTKAQDGEYPSDHFGVATQVELRPFRAGLKGRTDGEP